MARTLLVAASILWLVAGLTGVAVGLLGAAGLQRLLPPLAIDLAALGGAVVAIGVGVTLVGVAHAAVVVGLAGRRRMARSAAILLSGTLAALLVVLAAAAAVSAAAVPARAPGLLFAAAAAAVAAAGYGVVAAQLVAEIRPRRGE